MKFYVVAPDGQKFGPADIDTLNGWIFERRITAQSILEDELGVQTSASQVPGLRFTVAETNLPPVGTQMTEQVISEPIYAHPPASQFAEYPRGATWGDALPVEYARKFNWGAFYFSWIWGLNHKAYLTLISLATGVFCFMPHFGAPVGIGLGIWYGVTGNQWAWQSGRFGTPEEMMACQNVWAKWALWCFVASVVVGALVVIAILITISTATRASTMGP